MRKAIPIGLILIAACSGEPKQSEQGVKLPSKVEEWAAIASAPKPGPDKTMLVDLQLQVTVTDGWHVYSLTQDTGGPTPMSVSVEPPYAIDGEIVGPPAVKAQDANFGIETETYSGEQVFRIPLKLAASSSVAPPPIEVKVRSQACSDNLCLPARTTRLTVTPESGTT
jgi:thiol:disulfide interchange protein DsbD